MQREFASPLFANPGRGVVLICDQAITDSLLIKARPRENDRPEIYLNMLSGILARSDLNVIFHRRRRLREQSGAASAIERWRQQIPSEHQARFRVIEAAPLDALLAYADLFVSFASPALVEGCRSGFKPVQIGRAVIGSEAFAHIFGDSDAFVERIVAGGFRTRLSLEEYSEFEKFVEALRGAGAARTQRGLGKLSANAVALARDRIVQEFRRVDRHRISPLQAIADVIANPVGAMRLLRGAIAGLPAYQRFARNANLRLSSSNSSRA